MKYKFPVFLHNVNSCMQVSYKCMFTSVIFYGHEALSLPIIQSNMLILLLWTY